MSPPGLGQVTVAPSASKTAQGPNPKEKLLAKILEAWAPSGLGQVSAMSPPGLGQVTVSPSASKIAQGTNPKENVLAQPLEAWCAPRPGPGLSHGSRTPRLRILRKPRNPPDHRATRRNAAT